MKAAAFLGMPVSWLIFGEKSNIEVDADVKDLIDIYRRLSPEEREKVKRKSRLLLIDHRADKKDDPR